jgi:hypothetical protein
MAHLGGYSIKVMFYSVKVEKRGRYPLVTLMSVGKYNNFSREELIQEIKNLKEKKKQARGQLDINSINRELRIVIHILERRK